MRNGLRSRGPFLNRSEDDAVNRLVSLSISKAPKRMSRPSGSSMFRHVGALAVAAIALSGATLFAHDMWIEPTTFSPEPGAIVGARLRIGQDLLGDPLPRDPALINQFVVEDGEGRRPLIGRHGADPAGLLRVAAPGLL